MTFQELHDACDIELDKHEAPWFDAPKKDYFLNNAQDIIVDLMHEQFEVNEQARKDAVSLVRRGDRNIATNYPYGVDRIYYTDRKNPVNTVDYPYITELRYILEVRAKFEICGENTWVPVKPIRWDEISSVENNSFYKPTDSYPLYIEYQMTNDPNFFVLNDNLILIKSDSDPKESQLTYMKEPKSVDAVNNPSNEPDLVQRMHKHLVDIAVDLMLENIESQRQKSHYSKFKKYLNYEREPIYSNGG